MHHVTRRNWAETPGGRTRLGAARGRVRARGGSSHNSIPPSRPRLEAWDRLVRARPWRLGLGKKGTLQPGVRQVNTMLTAAELKAALDTASAQVTALGRQLEEAEVRSETVVSRIITVSILHFKVHTT